MATTIYPSQLRTVDPYESYGSNIVNRITRMITKGEDVILAIDYVDVTLDSTSPLDTVIISPGKFIQSDVTVEFSSDFSVLMSDVDFYLSSSGGVWNEVGYYYITVEYEYIKAKPAPRARIKIIKPSQRNLYTLNGRYFFLKAVRVEFSGGQFQIASLHNYDPENPENKRRYARFYASVFDNLPSIYLPEYEGMIVYVRADDTLYWGTESGWVDFSSIRDLMDTYDCTVGQLAYIAPTQNKVLPAIATSENTLASCCVLTIGYKADGSGRVRLYGKTENVNIESGITVSSGDVLYLSAIEAGCATNVMPSNYIQSIGWAIEDGSSHVDIWFAPGVKDVPNDTFYDKYQDLLTTTIFKRLTTDTLINFDHVDTIRTTTELNLATFKMEGSVGDVFYSTNLIAPDYDSTSVLHCQLSSYGDNQNNQEWYITNSGWLDTEWEPINLNEIHVFSTKRLDLIDTTSSFAIGEIITGQTSLVTGIVVADYGTYILLGNITGIQNFTIGETIIGMDSGALAEVNSQTDRTSGYIDIKIKCVFTGDSSIEDYGLLYDVHDQYTDYIDAELINLETLYSDIYTTPSMDGDGAPNLSVPLETCKTNIRNYVGASDDLDSTPEYTTNNFIIDGESLTQSVSRLDTALATVTILAGVYVSSGTFAGAGNSDIVNHNLGSTNVQAFITPSVEPQDLGYYWWSISDEDNIRVYNDGSDSFSTYSIMIIGNT